MISTSCEPQDGHVSDGSGTWASLARFDPRDADARHPAMAEVAGARPTDSWRVRHPGTRSLLEQIRCVIRPTPSVADTRKIAVPSARRLPSGLSKTYGLRTG